ncbi:MAG: Eco57I restriction-modification methylase domain-containing protein [Bacteroidales bacterium]|nr:Eco57I restriction-modification methylase domain-containing protein [Bacteroidales bacterium]
MNTETLRQIFQSPFNYPLFSREIVHGIFGCNDVQSQPELIDTSSLGDSSYYVGQMEDCESRLLGFFYTRVAEGSDVRRKRVGLRKLIQPYLRYEVDAAIAVFDDGQHWRLSYICDHKEGTTSAKRFSYVLGDKQGQYKTPLERLDRVAAKAGHFKMDDLRDAFSVDALSKEFFDEYHRHYDRICDYIIHSHINTLTQLHIHDYVKKMMGRIVFLHFLQKKGWLNDDQEFLSKLFFLSPYKQDFLEQELEPLFFGIFNTEPDKREQLFHQELWDLRWLAEWEKLPYLNGGLFERDEVDKMKIKLPASLFENLFKFMASYNFTIDENDPDDADIGIDPEMLGKIFESLLEDNKAKGAFYTPKEIVRYMCKESLIAYLNSKVNSDEVNSESKENQITNHDSLVTAVRQFVEQHEFPEELEPYREVLDTALRNVKICDPAIGSGAFPMGLLNELWRCREALGERATSPSQMGSQATGLSQAGSLCSKEGQAGNLYPYSRAALKREIIENNIYGVDIEKGAIDIARLRFWLSIVVDAEKPEPLPNFDYKFMQGNSLIESFGGYDLSHIMDKKVERNGKTYYQRRIGGKETVQVSMDFFSNDTRQNLRIWLKRYFTLTNHHEKTEYRKRINESVKSYIKQQGIGPSAETKLDTLDPSANQDFFLWHTWFKDIFDNGGFDIVIGNPPYINVENLDEKTKVYLFTHYSTCQGRTDIYIGFIEKAIALMNNNGVTSFIIPYSYTNQNYGELSRKMLAEKYSIDEIVDTSNYYVFDNAVVKNIIIRFGKRKGDFTLIRIADNKECFEQANFGNRRLPTKTFLQLKNCRIETKPFENILGIKENIEKASIRLGKIYLVAYGVRVNNKYDKNKPKNYYIHDTPQAQYKKFTEGKCIDRYTFTQYGWLNYCPNEHYNSMFPELFENEKLMFINVVSKGLRFAYDNDGYYNSHTVVNCVNISKLTKVTHPTAKKAIKEGNVILAKNYSTKFVLGLINSKLINWYFMQFQSEGLHCYPDDAKQFPIIKVTPEQQQPIINLVDQILEKKRDFPNANTSALEQEIDKLVYQLYNLTPEEIAVIEQ